MNNDNFCYDLTFFSEYGKIPKSVNYYAEELMKTLRRIFSRTAIVLLAILIQLIIYIYITDKLAEKYLYISLPFNILSVLFVIVVINRKMSASYKIPWLIVLMVMPIIGVALYLLLGYPRLTRRQRKELVSIYDETAKYCEQDESTLSALKDISENAYGQVKYLLSTAGMPVHIGTQTEYLDSGEAAFEVMKKRLACAKKYIFMEYFTIEEGKMWNEILAILETKIHEGVEVKLIYDDFGCAGKLKHNYNEIMCKKGIDCIKFNRITPFITAFHNNRDHRKITVIDGMEAFVGGFNLCDEYINEISPFGYWKDSAVYLRGEAVRNLSVMFLRQFSVHSGNNLNFDKYLQTDYTVIGKGYVLPFGDGPAPLYEDHIGEDTYLNIINQAKRYVYISTPYLIVDYHFTKALKAAAKRGVDIRIITPGIPDKKIINIMTKSSYEELVKGGVKIYEFSPGFIHAKTFVCDDEIGVVGSINLDYRSFVHHFECGVWMCGTSAVAQMKADFDNTFLKCDLIDEASSRLKWYQRLVASVLMVFAPLL